MSLGLVLLVWVLIVVVRIVSIPARLLNSERIQKKHGFLFLNLKYKFKISRAFNLLFILRRVAMSFIFVHLRHLSGIQVQLVLVINLIIMISVHKFNFFQRNEDNQQERVNESFICLCSIMMVLFTDFCPSQHAQYYFGGWPFVILFVCCIIFNLSLMIG
jgi:hypothetical protein